MKASKYNFFSRNSNNELIAFNAISSALAKMDDEHYRAYKLIEEGNEHLSNLNEEKRKEIYKNLERGRFIYDEKSYNENDVISTGYDINRYYTNHLNLTIAPTMNCNFDCYYCYEKKLGVRKSRMGSETEKDIIKFVNKLLKNRSQLKVTWYGGEPLLEKEIIYRLSRHLLKLCREKKCYYNAAMVSNGFYLDRKVVDKLVKFRISEVQITVDGLKEDHDSRRFDKKEGPSFDRIIENIKYAKNLMKIFVRVNIDRRNIDKVEGFLNYLKENISPGNITIYLGRVAECDFDMGPISNVLLSPKEYYEKEKEILIKSTKGDNKVLGFPYPNPSVLPCGAVNFNTFAIDPDGYVYKCWEVLGEKEEAVFHISQPNLYSKKQLEWVNWNPRNIEECRECKHLPLCSGGCVIKSMRGKKVCTYWKHHLDDMLEILAYKYEKDQEGIKNV